MYATKVATEEHIHPSIVRPTLCSPICLFYHPQSCTSNVEIQGEVNHQWYIACVN